MALSARSLTSGRMATLEKHRAEVSGQMGDLGQSAAPPVRVTNPYIIRSSATQEKESIAKGRRKVFANI